MMSLTSEVTIPVKAAPITTPTARSMALPTHGEFLEFLRSGSWRNLELCNGYLNRAIYRGPGKT